MTGSSGRAEPELGGDPSLVDVIGLNFYPHNQWYFEGPDDPDGPPRISPARRHAASKWPSATASRSSSPKPAPKDRPSRPGSIMSATRCARRWTAAPTIEGICWYPITAYPGWDNSRHAEAGLLSTSSSDGSRHVDERLLEEFEAQRALFGAPAGSRQPWPAAGAQVTGAACGSSDGVPTNGQPSRHSIRSISRIRRLLISSSCRWRGPVHVDRVIDDPHVARPCR